MGARFYTNTHLYSSSPFYGSFVQSVFGGSMPALCVSLLQIFNFGECFRRTFLTVWVSKTKGLILIYSLNINFPWVYDTLMFSWKTASKMSAASAYRSSSYNPTVSIALRLASEKGGVVSSCGENVWEGHREPPTALVVY